MIYKIHLPVKVNFINQQQSQKLCIIAKKERKIKNDKKVPKFVQTDHTWKDNLPQPHVLRADGRDGHHKRRLHRPEINRVL